MCQCLGLLLPVHTKTSPQIVIAKVEQQFRSSCDELNVYQLESGKHRYSSKITIAAEIVNTKNHYLGKGR
jgi:hypothetical protein